MCGRVGVGGLGTVAFVNLAGAIAGIAALALITAIVTAVMANAGAEASVNAVASDPTTTNAFLDGWRVAFLVQAAFMVAAALIGLRYRPPFGANDQRI